MVLSSVTYSSSPHLHLHLRMLPPKTPAPPPIMGTTRRRTIISCSSSSSPISPTSLSTTTRFDLKTYWTTLIKEINQKLDEAIPVRYPHQIYEAMRYSVLAKGAKRAPPVMCVAACELLGGNRLAAFPTACALEMVLSSIPITYCLFLIIHIIP